MAFKNSKGEYFCSYCEKTFKHVQEADACRDNHNLVYVPLTAADLNHIIQYFYTQEEDLLDPKLIKRLQKYSRMTPT
jgi:hypothetical protein